MTRAQKACEAQLGGFFSFFTPPLPKWDLVVHSHARFAFGSLAE